MERTRKPYLPGEILKELYLDPLSLSITAFAEQINVSRKAVSSLINGHTSVTVDMAMRLSIALNTTPELWLRLQQAVDLWEARQERSRWAKVKAVPIPA